MWIKIATHLRLYMIVTVFVSPGQTAVKKLLSGEQLHHEVCSAANEPVALQLQSSGVAGWQHPQLRTVSSCSPKGVYY
jgi:hypothetical protein